MRRAEAATTDRTAPLLPRSALASHARAANVWDHRPSQWSRCSGELSSMGQSGSPMSPLRPLSERATAISRAVPLGESGVTVALVRGTKHVEAAAFFAPTPCPPNRVLAGARRPGAPIDPDPDVLARPPARR